MRQSLTKPGLGAGLGGTKLHGLVQCAVQAGLRPKLSARPGVREQFGFQFNLLGRRQGTVQITVYQQG